MDYERGTMIDRTKTGLLLLIIGTILGPIPFIGIIGAILILIGVILVILGRHVFGETHSRNAIWSVGIYIVGLVVIFVFTIGFIASIISAASLTNNPSVLADAIVSSFYNFLIGLIIGSAISGIANVLFTYTLQKPTGRLLLWLGYTLGLVTGIVTFAVIGPQVSAVAQQAVSGGTFNRVPINALQAQAQGLGLLRFIPALIYAIAYYMAWSRVNAGEIPEAPTRQPGPTATTGSTRPF